MSTEHLTDNDRAPVRFANYAAGIDSPDPFKPMGPNLLGEALWPVTVERTEDRTRVGFSFLAPTQTGRTTP